MKLSVRFVACVAVVLTTVVFCAAEMPREQAWTVLNSGITSSNIEKRTKAVAELGLLIGDQQAEDAALTALKDDKSEVRAVAAQALGEMGAQKARPQLTAAIKDDDIAVVLSAAHALVQLGDESGYEVFYAVLTGQRKSGQSLLAQQKKMLDDPKKLAGLGFQTGMGFVPFGGIGLSAFKMITKDDTSAVLAAAAITLAADKDPKSGEAIANAAQQDKKWLVRAAAYEALAKRGDASLKGIALSGLTDENEQVQYAAAAAVIRLSDIEEHPPARPRITGHRPLPKKNAPKQ
jgi:HEAT repeat protein